MSAMGNKLRSSGKHKTVELKYSSFIDREDIWKALEHQPSDRVFSHCGVVKFVIDLHSNPSKPTPYFIQSRVYTYHYEFVQDKLDFPVNLSSFNDDQYNKWPRQFMLGTIVHYKDQGIYAFEIWPGDTMPAEGIVQCWKLLNESMPALGPILFRPCGHLHEKVLTDALNDPSIKGSIKRDLKKLLAEGMVSNETLFKSTTYQPLTIGRTVGTLRIVKGLNSDPHLIHNLERNDILVTDEIPNDLPPVRALITEDLQTPLCHVALLCSNRRAPNLAIKNAIQLLSQYDGKLVKLECNMLDWKVENATEADELEWKSTPQGKRSSKASNTTSSIVLKADDSRNELVYISSLSDSKSIAEHEDSIGAKATQIAKLANLQLPVQSCKSVISPSFVIPFSFYYSHLQKSIPKQPSESEPLESLIEQSKTIATRQLANLLGDVQEKLIESELIDDSIIDDIIEQFKEWNSSGGILENAEGVIFRSSTNVEDLPGFNGAGLYLSEPLSKKHIFNPEIVAETIKRVWASVWTVRGFMERNEFGIDQKKVRMAILVMPFLGKEQVLCNGVAITGNPFRSTFEAHFLNVQVGGSAVTDNCQGTTPEQILVYDDDVPTPETISKSSMNGGNPILNNHEIVHVLFPTFQKLHKHFAVRKKEKGCYKAVDIEFLILNNPTRDLVLLQCRPYTITYYEE